MDFRDQRDLEGGKVGMWDRDAAGSRGLEKIIPTFQISHGGAHPAPKKKTWNFHEDATSLEKSRISRAWSALGVQPIPKFLLPTPNPSPVKRDPVDPWAVPGQWDPGK